MKRTRNKIKEICESKGFSPYKLAKLLNTSPQTVYGWVNNKSNPNQLYLYKLITLLGLEVKDILEVEDLC